MACVSGLFDSYDEAFDAMAALSEAGIDPADVGLVTNHTVFETCRQASLCATTPKPSPVAQGDPRSAPQESSVVEALGIMTLPGIGAVAALGWVTASLVGVAGSARSGSQPLSLATTLQQSDISERDAETYSEALRRGSTLLQVRCSNEAVGKVEALLDEWGSVKIDERRDLYVAEGWIAFDRTMPPLTLEEIERDRRIRGAG
ncbi:hypothetical protein Brsp05_04443 [Brucella sp. NBRC 12953]|uniref:hypothetical protein n=1 Tax=Brucella sp. NBRC 12953 TaxID=3075481 RepID=UPI000DE50683